MSGLVRMMCPVWRSPVRCAWGVSPSYVPKRTFASGPPAAVSLPSAQLVLRQRFGGEEVERSIPVVFQNRLKHREVVAERLAAGRARRHDDVAPVAGGVDRLRLVAVEPLDSHPLERRLERGGQRALQPTEGRRAGRQPLAVSNLVLVPGLGLDRVEERVDVHAQKYSRGVRPGPRNLQPIFNL